MYIRKGRRRSQQWDYRSAGKYFLTIRSKGEWWFGDVKDNKVLLSEIGIYANKCLHSIPVHFPCASIDTSVIMPDHIHIIISIDNDDVRLVGTQHAVCLQSFHNVLPGSVSAIVRSYKSAVSKWAHENGYEGFRWQRSFYDKVLRDSYSLVRARSYIQQNPIRWIESVDE